MTESLRNAVSLFRCLKTVASAAGRPTESVFGERRLGASLADVREALTMATVDENGLGPVHHRILAILAEHRRPIAKHRLARLAGITAAAFRDFYELALLQVRAIVPTSRGIMGAAS